MPYSETDYIELCKKQLEEKFSFGNGNGHTQKDLELLSNYIETEKGVYISLSTLKRLWKNDFKQGPQLATLNALVSVLDYDNWQHFKLRNKGNTTSQRALGRGSWPMQGPIGYRWWKIGLPLLVLAAVPLLVLYTRNDPVPNHSGVVVNGPITFTADKTRFKGVPVTSIFKYNVSHIEADSFFIQQSWNVWRRERIDPAKTVFSSIYYESGYHRARLIANDSVVAQQPIHILSDGWEAHSYYSSSDERFIDFMGESYIADGQLQLSEQLLRKRNVDLSKRFITRVTLSEVFGISSNNFDFMTRAKVDRVVDSNCPWFKVYIVTEKHIFYVDMVRKGCEIHGAYKMGEITRNGKDNDLSLLGQDLYDWQEIGIRVKDKHAEIRINGQLAYSETFGEDFGKIMG